MYGTWNVLASFPLLYVYVTVICECQEMLDPYGVIQQKRSSTKCTILTVN